MPEISRFLGIVITMYYRDHRPPHFHAGYGECQAAIAIGTGAVLAGQLPARAGLLVDEWRQRYKWQLERNWQLAQAHRPLEPIEPLT